MFYIVYRIINTINGKFYIGKHQTENVNDGYMGSGKLLRRAIQKYGIDKFTKDILFVFDNEQEMNKKEKELVIVSEQTYNLCDGGQGGFGYINKNGFNYKGFNSVSERNRTISPFKKRHTFGLGNGGWKVLKKEKRGIFAPNFKPNGFLGKRHTELAKKKIGCAVSKSLIGNKNRATPIEDSSGNKFDSIIECAKFYGVSTETIRKWRLGNKL